MLVVGAGLWTACSGAAEADYRLGAGDLLKVSINGYPDMSTEVRVSESGRISYPFVGELEITGLSTAQLEALLARRLTEGGYIRQAQVSVLVSDYQSQKVAIMGQVTTPGQYPLYASRTILELLAAAGGVLNATAAEDAVVLHRDGSKAHVDLYGLFAGQLEQNLPVRGGDTIYVPKAHQFYIYGEVQRPGVYRLERDMTVSQAISAGGGLTPRGTERRAIVKRREGGHGPREIGVDGAATLLPDDVLLIKPALF